MNPHRALCVAVVVAAFVRSGASGGEPLPEAALPAGVVAVWDLAKAYRETTPTRERLSLNGLWRWQPATASSTRVPARDWGHFKVPGCWPGITDYMQKDCQTVYVHPSWQNERLGGVTTAWYQREVAIPATWAGRRIALYAEYVNSFATVFLDGSQVGAIRFPAGEVDLSAACRPGATHVLSVVVEAMPLKGVMLSYNDTNSARRVTGAVARRGLCGDVYLEATPAGARVGDVKVATSVRRGEITFEAGLVGVPPATTCVLRAEVTAKGRQVGAFTSKPFTAGDLANDRFSFAAVWKPDELWDTNTPQNTYEVTLSLLAAAGQVLDVSVPRRFGFREFWIDGRDFYLNGTRIFLCAVPFDNAQVGAAWSTYDGARESLKRLQSFGINAVYTHNYGCEPGTHLSFAEILRAADDVGMLVSLSQPHFGQYDWDLPDAEQSNGYASHAEFYVRAAQNHPAVVMYSMSHNATGYSEDMNPDLIDGLYEGRSGAALRNAQRALRAEAIVARLDPTRPVYHHSSGNLGSMHTSNFYPNFVPIQEMSDWFEHWATQGVKPFFSCEYGAPFTWDWAMYRGWYRGARTFGSAVVPWDFCLAEWNAQFLGDAAYRVSEEEKRNLRWEAAQFRAGNLWHRWDYPQQLGSRDFSERYPILAAYLQDNWRAFRTWGVSATSPWEHSVYWTLRPEVDRNRRVELATDWDGLQRPGFSPDYLEERYERMDLAYAQTDWVPTLAAAAMQRNNMPLLAYVGGKPGSFTSKDHNFLPGETVEKQFVVINNSRQTVTCTCTWALGLPTPAAGSRELTLATGQQERLPLRFGLPGEMKEGVVVLTATATFSTGETQTDSFTVHVLPPVRPGVAAAGLSPRLALFDPQGETTTLLSRLDLRWQPVEAGADLTAFDALIIGKAALTPDGPGPDLRRVREGLRVLVFEQTAAALEKRLGFRVASYGLRNVFRRVPGHAAVKGLDEEHLRDWRGAATLVPARLEYDPSDTYSGSPTVRWCGLEVPRLWRCGNRGNVASVLIEKPACGDFLPLVDGGFSLQYSPLLEYREGRGRVLFCQLDVTGRTESDPGAERLLSNLVSYVCGRAEPAAVPDRRALYIGVPAGRRHLERAGVKVGAYTGGTLTLDDVLIVGAGADKDLATHATALGAFVKAGGNVLGLGLEEGEANRFLAAGVSMKTQEHIATWFQPPDAGSLFAGCGPADLHNRDPRELPLVVSGAEVLGDGVLARATGTNAVFCQLTPYSLVPVPEDAPGVTVAAGPAADGTQSALLTLGTVPWAQFGQKVTGGQPGETYTFSASVMPLGDPASVRLEVERAGKPWDRVVRGQDSTLPPDQWTELHVTYSVDQPYPEGWQAYVHCASPGARLRVDRCRLQKGAYAPAQTAGAAGDNRFTNASFETGTAPWFFTWRTEQQNLRKTFRRNAFLLSRLLANMGVRGETPLLSRFSTPASGPARESGIRNGDFSVDADNDGMPDGWQFSANSTQAVCALDDGRPAGPARALRLTCAAFNENQQGTLMLSQQDVPAVAGQWYLLSFRAKADDFKGATVTAALQSTSTWHSILGYQRFSPTAAWKEFTFRVQATATAPAGTRFQIWHGNLGTLWLADVRLTPCDPPAEGRWSAGLYLDRVQEWDDPYRFFRW